MAFFIFGGRGFRLMYLCRTGSGFYVYSFSMMDFFAGFVSQYLGIVVRAGLSPQQQEDHRDPYMWIKSFTANGSVLDALTLNRGSEMMYVYSRTNEILVSRA